MMRAPISKSLKISEALFTGPQAKPGDHANIYKSNLDGFLKILVQAYQDESSSIGFRFHIDWSLINQTGEVVIHDQFRREGNDDSKQVWVNIPLRGSLSAGTYLLVIHIFESNRNESLGYQQEIIIEN